MATLRCMELGDRICAADMRFLSCDIARLTGRHRDATSSTGTHAGRFPHFQDALRAYRLLETGSERPTRPAAPAPLTSKRETRRRAPAICAKPSTCTRRRQEARTLIILARAEGTAGDRERARARREAADEVGDPHLLAEAERKRGQVWLVRDVRAEPFRAGR